MVYEKKCAICGKWFYTVDEENDICSETCQRDIRLSKYEKAAKNKKNKRFKTCVWCGTQHYNRNSYCSDKCEEKDNELMQRRKNKCIKCKYMKYIDGQGLRNMMCDFRGMTKYNFSLKKPCEKGE